MQLQFKDLKKIQKEKTVYIPGVFDLFHIGHLKLLKKIKKQFPKHKIVVGIMSDEFVIKCKNPKGPIINQNDRITLINSCKYVDYSFICPFWQDKKIPQFENIKDFKPDYVIYKDESYLKFQELFLQLNSKIIIITSNSKTHTSSIIDQIKSKY